MRRACSSSLLPLALAALLVAVLAAGAGARSAPALRATTAAGSNLQVIQVEYRLILSRGTVKAGPVSLEAIDRGMDPHDLRLRASAHGADILTPQLTSQQRWDGVVRLKPGIYQLWCSLPEHAKRGMHATLRVVR
jgi:uncharacterized cupredoxin-like copper-binding protein